MCICMYVCVCACVHVYAHVHVRVQCAREGACACAWRSATSASPVTKAVGPLQPWTSTPTQPHGPDRQVAQVQGVGAAQSFNVQSTPARLIWLWLGGRCVGAPVTYLLGPKGHLACRFACVYPWGAILRYWGPNRRAKSGSAILGVIFALVDFARRFGPQDLKIAPRR